MKGKVEIMQIPDDAKQCILLAVREDGLQYDATYELVRLTEEYIHSFIGEDVQVADWDYGYKIMYDSMAQETGKAVNRWYTCGDEKKLFFGNFLIYAEEYDDDFQSHVEEVQARFIPVSSVKYQFNLSRKMREVIITTRLSPEIGGYDMAYKVSDIFKRTPLNQLKIYREYFKRGTIIELVEPINDPFSPKPAGARFKVSEVDDACQLHGVWLPPESGSMAVDIEHDCYVKIE